MCQKLLFDACLVWHQLAASWTSLGSQCHQRCCRSLPRILLPMPTARPLVAAGLQQRCCDIFTACADIAGGAGLIRSAWQCIAANLLQLDLMPQA